MVASELQYDSDESDSPMAVATPIISQHAEYPYRSVSDDDDEESVFGVFLHSLSNEDDGFTSTDDDWKRSLQESNDRFSASEESELVWNRVVAL